MKSAEEWRKDYPLNDLNKQTSTLDVIKAIQLDAWKAGMMQAQNIVKTTRPEQLSNDTMRMVNAISNDIAWGMTYNPPKSLLA